MSLPQLDDRLCPDPCAGPCGGCTDRIVCRCLTVTEGRIVEAVTTLGLRTVKDVRAVTGAGDGCTCCHQRLKQLIACHAQSSSPAEPICS
jgi:NAD(P)H-nitrite reductase large subunit